MFLSHLALLKKVKTVIRPTTARVHSYTKCMICPWMGEVDTSVSFSHKLLTILYSFYTWLCISFTHDFIFVVHMIFTYIVSIRLIGIRVTHDVNSFYTWLAHVLHMMWFHFTHDWYTCYTWCEFIIQMMLEQI